MWILKGSNGVVDIYVSASNPVEVSEHKYKALQFTYHEDAVRLREKLMFAGHGMFAVVRY